MDIAFLLDKYFKVSMMPIRFLLVLMMLMAPSFAKAQTSFDPEEWMVGRCPDVFVR